MILRLCLCVCVPRGNCSECPPGKFRHQCVSACLCDLQKLFCISFGQTSPSIYVCACVCVYVCLCVYVTCRNCSACSSGRFRHQRMSVCVYVSMLLCVCVTCRNFPACHSQNKIHASIHCINIDVFVYTEICMYSYVHIELYLYLCVHSCLHICCRYTSICIYAYIDTYIFMRICMHPHILQICMYSYTHKYI